MAWKPDYVTLAEFKAYLELTNTTHDAVLPGFITAASRDIDKYCSGAVARQFGKLDDPAQRTYELLATRRGYVAEIDDLQDVTDLVVEADGTVTTDYTLEPVNAPADGEPYTRIRFASRVCEAAMTGLWGWSAVPDQVPAATNLQGAVLFYRRKAPFGISGSPDSASSGGGGEMRLLARVDPNVAVLLRGLRREGAMG